MQDEMEKYIKNDRFFVRIVEWVRFDMSKEIYGQRYTKEHRGSLEDYRMNVRCV